MFEGKLQAVRFKPQAAGNYGTATRNFRFGSCNFKISQFPIPKSSWTLSRHAGNIFLYLFYLVDDLWSSGF